MATIKNTTSNYLISGTSGDDTIYNRHESYTDFGSYVTIKTGAGNDSVKNTKGECCLINTGSGNDTVYNNKGYACTIKTGSGNDSVYNYGYWSLINTGTGDDTVYSYGERTIINTGEGNDSIYNAYCWEGIINYSSGDGNDVIYGFNNNRITLSISGSSYSTEKSGDDIIVTVGDGKISLIGAASLSAVNIVSDETPATKWTLDGTTATYGDLVIKGVKSLDGISLNASTVTISKASLGTSKVTISNGYTLALADDVNNATTKTAWSLSGTKATYKQTTTAGYTLADNVITYTKKATKTLATVSGVKSTKGLSVDGKVVTVSKSSLGTSKVTISDGYTLALADDVDNATTKTAWSLSNSTATYKQTKTAGYALADNVITYTKKATKTLATVSGVKSTKGLSVDGKVVTVSKASLGTRECW